VKRKARLLVVDDDPGLLRLLTIRLRAENYDVEAVESASAALAALARVRPDLVLTDLRMDQMDGIGLLKEIQTRAPGLRVIILTAHGTIPDAVQATQSGAFAFLTKPVDKQELLDQVQKALKVSGFADTTEDWRSEIVTRSAVMEERLAQAHMVAGTDARVMITGESGTGKELLARAIHKASPRRNRPFVAINCSAMAENLLESELFGHVKGAFTDARTDRVGRFEMADGGTLFLDEIANVPLSQQAKLLRVLETGELERVGSSKTHRVDVRIVSATNAELKKEAAAGRFREDLLFRLNTVEIHLPLLRERREDIPLLAQHFLSQLAQRYRNRSVAIDAEAMKALISYDWPGNVRELNHVIERAVLMAQGDTIRANDLGLQASRSGERPLEEMSLEEVECFLIKKTLARFEGNASKAAEALGLSRSAFYRRLDKYRL
jgi:two-component system, NtrC family, response regulator GlrR